MKSNLFIHFFTIVFYFSVTVHVIANLGADTWHLGSNESTVSVEGNRFLLTGFQSVGG